MQKKTSLLREKVYTIRLVLSNQLDVIVAEKSTTKSTQ